MRISFHGGAQEVTGACYLLETNKTKLLVDCGLFQGCDECSGLNFKPFKFKPAEIRAVLVTHAHLDHVGRIPKLVKEGFRGKVYSTPPTKELARLILEDALSLAERFGEKLYEAEDLEKTFGIWETKLYHEELILGDVKIRFNEAGHILGSALIEAGAGGKRLLFSGDLGNIPSFLLPPPERFKDIDYLIIESTYGSRTHEGEEERILQLERAVEDVTARKGTLMIPAFATERTQEILFLLNEMLLFKRIPEVPVFVDSPMAIKATRIFENYPDYYKEETRRLHQEHPHLFKFKRLKTTETVEESKAINDVSPPKVILAGSGMMNGGRILHHARRYLSDPNSILLIIGYQAAGSLGRRLIDGEKTVKLFGEDMLVRCEVRKINGFSAHADNPQLFSSVASVKDTLKKVFVVQGEPDPAFYLMQEIKDRLGIPAETPMLYDEYEI